jgi:hypothetical protein
MVQNWTGFTQQILEIGVIPEAWKKGLKFEINKTFTK